MENSIDIFLIIVLVLIIPIANAIFLYSKYKQYNLYIKYKKLSSKMQLATFESDAYDLKNEIENLYKFIDSHSSTGILNFLIYGFIPNYKHNIKRAEQMQNESVISCFCILFKRRCLFIPR